MRRFLLSAVAALVVSSVGSAALADSMHHDMMMKPMMCKKGYTMVKGYMSHGHMVKPYCRKAPMMMHKHM